MAYTKQTWTTGETIVASKLNNIETAIYDNSVAIDELNTNLAYVSAATGSESYSNYKLVIKSEKNVLRSYVFMSGYDIYTIYLNTTGTIRSNSLAGLGNAVFGVDSSNNLTIDRSKDGGMSFYWIIGTTPFTISTTSL